MFMQAQAPRDASCSFQSSSLERTDMEMLLTTKISLSDSARDIQEEHLQALRERLMQETENFFDRVGRLDPTGCENESVSRQLANDNEDYEEDCSEDPAASPDTSRHFLQPSRLTEVEGYGSNEITDNSAIKLAIERQHQEVKADDNSTSRSSSRSPTSAMERVRLTEEDNHFATVLRRREELLRQKRAAIPSNPPALRKTMPVSNTTTGFKTQTVVTNGDGEKEMPNTANGVTSDAVMESLREVASLKPELGDIDLLSLGMKANASRILAQYSIPLPLGDTDSTRRKTKKQAAPVTYALPYVHSYPQRYPAWATSTRYFPVGLPVRPAPLFLTRQTHDVMHCPNLWQPSRLVYNQRPATTISGTFRGTCSANPRSPSIDSLPRLEEHRVFVPEGYARQSMPAAFQVENTIVASDRPVEFDAKSTHTREEQKERHVDPVDAQLTGATEDSSSMKPQENPSTPCAIKKESDRDGIGVRSLMATSQQHQMNIRRFMSRLPDQYRRKPYQRSSVTDKTKCDICGKVMARKGLMVHRRIHIGDKRFKCEICSRTFTQACNMRTHLKVHFKVKEHKCSYCGKVFSRAQHLYEHERIHTGERPYVCRFCGCSFKAYSTLYSHIGTHTGHKYECQACHRTFAKACNLETHIRSKHTRDSVTPVNLRRIGGSESSSRDSASPESTTQA